MKRTESVDVLHEETNFVVLKMPKRAYPGVLIQGDSLLAILGEVEEAITHFDRDQDESRGCLQNAFEELKWRVDGYQRVCEENGIS